MDRAIEMLVAAERALVQNRCLTIPCVFVRPDVDKATSTKVKEVVRRHQGTIAETEADATHIVYPTADPLEEEYARPCMRRDRSVLLHWYYFPDSHDSWTLLDLPWDFPEGPISSSSGRYDGNDHLVAPKLDEITKQLSPGFRIAFPPLGRWTSISTTSG